MLYVGTSLLSKTHAVPKSLMVVWRNALKGKTITEYHHHSYGTYYLEYEQKTFRSSTGRVNKKAGRLKNPHPEYQSNEI